MYGPRLRRRRTSDYQVRKYEPFVVAQTWMDDVKGASTTDASASTSASSNPVLINPAGVVKCWLVRVGWEQPGGHGKAVECHCAINKHASLKHCRPPLLAGALACPAAGGSRAFGTLARYLFGGNERKEAMKMTTPVFSDTQGTMQFVMEPSKHKVGGWQRCGGLAACVRGRVCAWRSSQGQALGQ